MSYLFGFVALLLAGAIVVLFAMLGELSSRVGPAATVDRSVTELSEALIGRSPDVWPDGLSVLGDAEEGLALVLSTACGSCKTVAEQLRSRPELASGNLALVISTSDAAGADQFVKQFNLERIPRYVDVDGDWVTAEFGVQVSPTALMFRRGQLTAALVFADVETVRAVRPPERQEANGQEETWQDTPMTTGRRV